MRAAENIIYLMNQYKVSNALYLLTKYKVFDYLDGVRTTAEVAEMAGVKKQSLEIILNIFVGNKMVQRKTGSVYALELEYYELLNSQSSYSYIPLIQLEQYLAAKHTSVDMLEHALLHGKGRDEFNQEGKENQEGVYGAAMEHGSQVASVCVARELLSIGSGTVLDIGGGSGTYACALCKFNKNISVDLVDKPEMKSVCVNNIQKKGLEGRIRFLEGDINEMEFEQSYQGVILSNILHLLNPAQIQKLVEKVFHLLADGGIAVFHDFFLKNSKTEPKISSYYTLDWMMQGSFFQMNTDELSELLIEQGFKVDKVREYNGIDTIVLVVSK